MGLGKKNLACYKLLSVVLMWKSAMVQSGNLALRQPSQFSAAFTDASYAVDGNSRGANPMRCAITQHHDNPYWVVDLGRTYIVDEVFLIGRSDCCLTRMIGGEIRVGNQFGSSSVSNPKCADIPSFSGQLKSAFKCSPGLRGRYVSVHLPGSSKEIALCEVMVNRNPTGNIALQKPTTQSSEVPNGAPSRAVDGNLDARFEGASCSHTVIGESLPWWRVDLGSSKPVSEIFIVNRDVLQHRLNNFEVRVGDSLNNNGNSNPRCGRINTMATLSKKSFYCKPRKTGRYVNIRIVPTGALTLCEVEIYSESKAVVGIDQIGVTAIQGIPLTLTCPVFGYPTPFVAWVRGGVVHQNATTTSVFNGTELNENLNESTWECLVSNIHGEDFHQFHIKGVSWHRMCAKFEVLAGKRAVNDVANSPDHASNDTGLNESVWYRLQHPATQQSMQIPESCTPSMRCSTQASGWLLGAHPGSILDGVVRRNVCFSWRGECCKYRTTVLVRKCHGFYVYRLQKPSFDIKAGYCTEISRTVSPYIAFQQVIAIDGSRYAVQNYVIHTEPDLEYFECLAVCLSHQSCKSINYDSRSRSCEMNSANRSDVSSSDWVKRPGNSYFEMMKVSEWLIL